MGKLKQQQQSSATVSSLTLCTLTVACHHTVVVSIVTLSNSTLSDYFAV